MGTGMGMTLQLPARMASLAQAMALLEDHCGAQGVDAADTLRLSLVLEELYTNTVQHGHGGDCDEPVCLGCQVEPEHLVLDYVDQAPPFDPRIQAMAQVLPKVEDRPIGGLGLMLVGQLSESLDYRYEQGRNRLKVRLRRVTAPETPPPSAT
jgi:anti-sigma regulatory factor (Ser/Thr protein kinase)